MSRGDEPHVAMAVLVLLIALMMVAISWRLSRILATLDTLRLVNSELAGDVSSMQIRFQRLEDEHKATQ